jgi:hypothetical protein
MSKSYLDWYHSIFIVNSILGGSLEAFGPERILRLLAETDLIGALSISSGQTTVTFWLSGSTVRFADRGEPGAFRRLLEARGVAADLLERLGMAGPDAANYPTTALTELAGAQEAAEWSRAHTIEALVDVLLFRTGEFSVSEQQATPAGVLESTIAIDSLLEMAAGRLESERASIEQAVFLPTLPGGRDRFELSATELRLLLAADGKRTLAEIAGSDAAASLSTTVLRLTRSGFLHPQPAPAIRAAPPPAAAEREPARGPRIGDPPRAERPAAVPLEPPARRETPAAAARVSQAAPAEPDPAGTVVDLPIRSVRPEESSGSTRLVLGALTLEDSARTSFPLFEESYTIGRELRNQIQIVDPSVSGSHARIIRTETGFEIEDLGSRNGTWVNGEKIERKLLADQDSIRFGSVYTLFSLSTRLRPSPDTMPNPVDR